MSVAARADTPQRVIRAYIVTNALFTLAASLIWAINTIFLEQRGGLNLFQVMLVNTAFVVAQMVCEVPTGVIADTIGRKASYLLSIATIIISTILYVLTPIVGWGFWGFVVASLIIGLGFTFQTGAVDAWMVDALDYLGWEGPKDRVFAWGGMGTGAAVLVGSLLGGLLGQIDLVIPYLVRAAVLVAAFILVLFVVHDTGFEPRPLKLSTFGSETRKIFDAGVTYGWHSRVVRPLLFTSLITGLFYIYGFYSWQPYVLQLLGKNAIWLLGVVQAGSSLAGIAGNALVMRVRGRAATQRESSRLLITITYSSALIVGAIGLVGIALHQPGIVPAAIAIGLWLGWGVIFGIFMPVRANFINEYIPSAQRATVLSLDSLFGDAGGAVGQPVLGYVSTQVSISAAWTIGAVCVALAGPLYGAAGRAARAQEADRPTGS